MRAHVLVGDVVTQPQAINHMPTLMVQGGLGGPCSSRAMRRPDRPGAIRAPTGGLGRQQLHQATLLRHLLRCPVVPQPPQPPPQPPPCQPQAPYAAQTTCLLQLLLLQPTLSAGALRHPGFFLSSSCSVSVASPRRHACFVYLSPSQTGIVGACRPAPSLIPLFSRTHRPSHQRPKATPCCLSMTIIRSFADDYASSQRRIVLPS